MKISEKYVLRDLRNMGPGEHSSWQLILANKHLGNTGCARKSGNLRELSPNAFPINFKPFQISKLPLDEKISATKNELRVGLNQKSPFSRPPVQLREGALQPVRVGGKVEGLVFSVVIIHTTSYL